MSIAKTVLTNTTETTHIFYIVREHKHLDIEKEHLARKKYTGEFFFTSLTYNEIFSFSTLAYANEYFDMYVKPEIDYIYYVEHLKTDKKNIKMVKPTYKY